MRLEIVGLVFAVFVGACVGSFLNVVIYRLPAGLSVWWPLRSFCFACKTPIRGIDNIPVVSYFVLRGRCRKCGERFSARYMFVEALTAVLTGWLFWVDAAPKLAAQPTAAVLVPFLYHAILVWALTAATFIDFDHYEIPDAITVPMMFVGVVGGALWPSVHLLPFRDPIPALPRAGGAAFVLWSGSLAVAWVLLLMWVWWFWRKRRQFLPGSAEWVILAAWLAFLVFHSVGFACRRAGGLLPNWFAWSARPTGLWTSVAGLLAGAGIVWFVRVAVAGFLRGKRDCVARLARQWMAAHPNDAKRGRRRARSFDSPDPLPRFYTWRIIFSGAGRINRWRRLGLWIAKEGMGFGDVTLMAAIGAFVGWQAAVIVFFLAPFIGLGVNLFHWLFRGQRMIPYGPYLSLATLVVLTNWGPIWGAFKVRIDMIVEVFGFVFGH